MTMPGGALDDRILKRFRAALSEERRLSCSEGLGRRAVPSPAETGRCPDQSGSTSQTIVSFTSQSSSSRLVGTA
jgi:hypothetical protein